MGSITQILEEGILGQRVVKIFDGTSYEQDRFDLAANKVRLFTMKTIITSAANSPIVQLVTVSALAGIVYIASLQSSNNEITAGEFMSFFGAMAMLITPIKRLTSVNEILQRGLAASESVFQLIDQPPEINPDNNLHLKEPGQIEFNNISLTYPGNDSATLKDIQLTIAPNETIALVGHSGSGKTTLANILPLIYQPSSGSVLINGINIQELPLRRLRDQISLVSQDIVLFNDTVSANIAYGSLSNFSSEQICHAAKQAHALDFIEELPNGFDTVIGEKGARLSGGQRQRLAIARALLKDAPILILDEATSALDSHSEKEIQAALDTLIKDRTTIIIAHRLSTISNADRIVVMQDGKIIEEGPHSLLYENDGLYTHLYNTQFEEN